MDPEKKSGETKKIKREVCMTKTFTVTGMMCQHCEAHVKKALEAIDGVESAVCDHDKNTAEITFSKEVSTEVLAKAVKDAGYEMKA